MLPPPQRILVEVFFHLGIPRTVRRQSINLFLVALGIGAIIYQSTIVDSHAINFATGTKVAPGFVLNLYPFYYSADTRSDKDGNKTVSNLGLKKYGVYIGNSYYVGDFLLNAIIPVGKLEVGALHETDSGLGDIQLRVGWFTPIKSVTILPVLMVKTPTGSFNKNRVVNFGDGQIDLAAELFLFKLAGPISLDALFRYTVRFKNRDTDAAPGNEFVAEGLATWKLAEKLRIGPAMNFIWGGDLKRGRKTLPDSGLTRLSAGGEIYYGRISQARVSLAAYKDLLARNSNDGFLVLSRIVFPF